MLYIGGEPETDCPKYYQDLTNSGRSSLRLIIESANLAGKHILLPDFLCQIIIDVLKEYEITYDLYNINSGFEFELPHDTSIYDALYLIKYFGSKTGSFINACQLFEQCLIIDDVFSPFPEVLTRDKPWFSYNSLRKITPIADLSLIYSNVQLASTNKSKLSDFSTIKFRAKYKKFDYLYNGIGNEEQYLDLFNKAENILDNSKGIYFPSNDSLILAMNYFSKLEEERAIRKHNYNLIRKLLPDITIAINSDFHSFVPILLDNRNQIRSKLMADNIFLAVHWPADSVHSLINDKVLSLPLDSRYNESDIKTMCSLIIKLKGS